MTLLSSLCEKVDAQLKRRHGTSRSDCLVRLSFNLQRGLHGTHNVRYKRGVFRVLSLLKFSCTCAWSDNAILRSHAFLLRGCTTPLRGCCCWPTLSRLVNRRPILSREDFVSSHVAPAAAPARYKLISCGAAFV